MVTIGNDTLPGTITTLESAVSAGVSLSSPGVPVIAGQGYLQGSTAEASANEVHRITRYRSAETQFGSRENSQLTRAVQDALSEGAYPVYAIAPEETEVTAEDLSGTASQSITLSNAPVQENADDITFTINGTTKDTVLYRDGDPSNASPGTDEVYLNPVTGEAYADEQAGNTSDEVSYWYLDYSNTFDAIQNHEISATAQLLPEVVDFVGLVTENGGVRDSLDSATITMETNGGFTIGLAGAGSPWIDDAGTTTDEVGSFSNSYDSSRLQLIHPSRDGDGNTTVGSYVGARGRIGISTTPIFKNLRTQSSLQFNLSTSQQEDLVNAKVNPIEQRSGSARIIEDLTTVSSTNSEEQAWTQGSARLITDYVAEAIDVVSAPFIGNFNDPDVRNTIKGNASAELRTLLENNQLQDYSLVVESEDDTTVIIDVGIEASSPLRNIDLTVSAGDVQGGVTTEGQ